MINKGILSAITAYFIWGLSPLYWKMIQDVPALEIIGHRIVWSFVLNHLMVVMRKEWTGLTKALNNRRGRLTILITGLLLSINWLVYIWAVNSNYIIDASLGYFINPLVNVVLGVVFFQEKLRSWQWVSVAIASLGVLYLTILYGALPWIGLVLAFSFGLYGLLKKKSELTSLHGFGLEMSFLLLPALAFLLYLTYISEGAFGQVSLFESILMTLTGVITGLPLMLFGIAAKRINLSTLGFIQYIAPTFQFLIGVMIFGEPISNNRMIGFSLIWLALILYSGEGILVSRQARFVVGDSGG